LVKLSQISLSARLWGLSQVMRLFARRHPAFARHMAGYDGVAQIRLQDGSQGRWFAFRAGRLETGRGLHANPDLSLVFRDLDTAVSFLDPRVDQALIVHAAKNFKAMVQGDEDGIAWFMQLLNLIRTVGWERGLAMPDGSRRFTQVTNGGPLFVYVKDGRILRVTPIEFDDSEDAPSWVMPARGQVFKPQRKANVAPHALAMKSTVYSDKRLLYPMKRVDFDPSQPPGQRNEANRGISGYERISWDEALDIVAGEILRMKREHGPGAIATYHSSHHQWGNVGYYLSALMRFGNAIGVTRVALNPDSWEGWYWGAMHHLGNSFRLGSPTNYGTLQDCLEACELIIFWSSDPESQFGTYGGQDGGQRRLWGKQLGMQSVHINPHYCPTAGMMGGKWMPIRPGTDNALAIAIMQVWIAEGLYDKEFVATRTTGFDEWRDYVMGISDDLPKTPEWQEAETGIPARDVRALARLWAKKKTYLAPGVRGSGLGGACRGANGMQWARAMILLMAMRGWGRPGVNFGNLQGGTPVDLHFYFPGYAEGGISGELNQTAAAANNYTRMPHLVSVNPVTQTIPRQRLPEAILDGQAEGYPLDPSSIEGQFRRTIYPAPGYSRVKMLYRYGGSSFGTIGDSNRFVAMYQSPNLEFVVNQSIWNEGEAKFADVILPACTQFERDDIGEWGNAGGFGLHMQEQLNHRVIAMQHRCIEPLGESKSDYQIFWDICKRLGLGTYFSEGMTELDWCRRVFDSTDLPKHVTWRQFLKKGYFVVPPAPTGLRPPRDMQWYLDGRQKDVPEPYPLPGAYSSKYGQGLQTQTGKIEFVSSSLKRFDPDSPDRPPLNRYIPAWESPRTEHGVNYPLQMITPHQRFSFHTMSDGKDSAINDIRDHRVWKDGHFWWILRMSPADAAARGIAHHDLVEVFNGRGRVICAADLTATLPPGVVHSFESCATYEPLGTPGASADIGGCMNLLTPKRPQSAKTSSTAAMTAQVQVQRWEGELPPDRRRPLNLPAQSAVRSEVRA
jgi:trimethylamine-N-oxide reductase (cytochrome c)